MFATVANTKQTAIPAAVGTSIEISVHFRLCVSFFIVRQVVEHGQCSSENSMTLIAVTHVQPLSTSSCFSTLRSDTSSMLPCAIYVMIMIGMTISLAGNPSINASKITPSSPKSLANGSRNPEQCAKRVTSPTEMFAIAHMTSPAGAATMTALPNTNRVRSKIERTMTLPICGRLYGGSSSVKDEGIPLSTVFERIYELRKVIATPSTIKHVSSTADSNDAPSPAVAPIKNIEMMTMNVGNRPLHGTKLFVMMAIIRSLGESMIRQPITPAALQPNPMHMGS